MSGRDSYYYNGPTRVDIVIARDELAVTGVRGRRASLTAIDSAVRGGRVTGTESGGAFVRYDSAADLAALEARAREIADSGADVAAVAYPVGAPRTPEQREAITRRLTIKLNGRATMGEIAALYGLRSIAAVEYSPNTYIAETISSGLFASIETANAIFENGLAEFATPLVVRQQTPRLIPNDSLFGNQWHLRNTGQVPGVAGEDVNIVGAWNSYVGTGINIAIADSGVQVSHPDLSANARTDIDIDINGGDLDPTPSSDSHGTSVAGIAAARGNNGTGVTGAAFQAGIVGIRLIEGPASDQDEADAMNHRVSETNPANYVHINSNSWGPADCGCILGGMGPLVEAALANGVANGRGGLGTVYVWAAGNGRTSADDVNYDAYASSRYTIAVGATGANGQFSWYSEPGASMLVNASSSDSISGTTTTTLPNTYTNSFGGTSSAAPLVAGVIALVLEANPDLSWRDVQHVLVDSAEKNHPSDSGWVANGSGRLFNHSYGFGRVDAEAAVALAEDWLPVPDYATPVTSSATPAVTIPDNNSTGVTSSIVISGAPSDFFIEHVEVVVNITHARRGNLSIELTGPSGFKSVLARVHSDTGADYSNWRFTSVGHWGEHPNGTWQLVVKDLAPGFTGTFNDWSIAFHGFQESEWVDPNLDTDQDLLTDQDEINIYGTNPFDPDTDDDGVRDGVEVSLGTNPLDPDDTPLLSITHYGWLGGLLLVLGILSGRAIGATESARVENEDD